MCTNRRNCVPAGLHTSLCTALFCSSAAGGLDARDSRLRARGEIGRCPNLAQRSAGLKQCQCTIRWQARRMWDVMLAHRVYCWHAPARHAASQICGALHNLRRPDAQSGPRKLQQRKSFKPRPLIIAWRLQCRDTPHIIGAPQHSGGSVCCHANQAASWPVPAGHLYISVKVPALRCSAHLARPSTASVRMSAFLASAYFFS